MSRLSRRTLTRLLASRRTVEPPPDLAARIKAEIPDFAAVGGTRLGAERAANMPLREAGYRPSLLVAATLLVVVGVGFIAAHLLEPPTDPARDVALGGVTVIDDIVITVPPRAASDSRSPAASPDSRAGELGVTTAREGPASKAQQEAVTVAVRHADGAPCVGATVRLERTDAIAVWHSETSTGDDGVASFPGVPPGTYSLSARVRGASPARLDMLHVAPKTVTRIDLRIAPRRRHTALPF